MKEAKIYKIKKEIIYYSSCSMDPGISVELLENNINLGLVK